MSPPLALAAAVASILLPGERSPASKPSEQSSVISSMGPFSNSSQAFILGVAAGLSVGSYLAAELRRNRIRERMRASYLAWLSNVHSTSGDGDASDADGEDGVAVPSHLMNPVAAFALEGTQIGESALVRVLADPSIALTSSLHTSLITLPSGTRMRPREARGVELYYIVQGVAAMSKDGNDNHCMTEGDAVVINPWTVRSMANRSRADVTFLRVADGGSAYNEDGFDVVAAGELDLPSTSLDMLKRGIKTMGSALGGDTGKTVCADAEAKGSQE